MELATPEPIPSSHPHQDAELGDENEENSEFHAFFFTPEYTEDEMKQEGETMADLIKEHEDNARGVKTEVWATRMAKLEKEFRVKGPLSGDALRGLAGQMSTNQKGSDGYAINWEDMEAFVCFGMSKWAKCLVGGRAGSGGGTATLALGSNPHPNR